MRFAAILGLAAAAWLPISLTGGGDREVTISGVVTDSSTGRPIAGARLAISDFNAVAMTDVRGAYVLALPASGVAGRVARVVASAPGYRPIEKQVTISETALVVDFELHTVSVMLDEIVPTEAEAQRKSASRQALEQAVTGGARFEHMRPSTAPATLGYAARDPGYSREGYAHIAENEFHAVDLNPLSTFSIDVDRASYSNVRRFVNDEQRPPIDAVRIEEMVNYFTYDYAEPGIDHPFSVMTDMGPAPWNPQHRLLRIGVQGKRVDLEDLPPSNLVFLLDVSGSMHSPDKLPLLKQSFRLLVNELRPTDRVAIVVYAGAAGLVLPSTSGAEKTEILDAIDRLEAGGSTAGGAGIRLAYRVARDNFLPEGNNRVILATDGDFNVGASSDAEMVRLIEEKRQQGTFLTVLGFGTGNLQDAKMEQLADHGNGNFGYIDNLMEARKVLVTEMGGTLLTIAKDVKIQVEFNPARVSAYRLVGYENRLMAAEDFNNDEKDAGELGAGHSVTALYEIVPVGVESGVGVGGVDSLRYQSPRQPLSLNNSGEIGFVKLRYKDPNGTRSKLIEHPIADRGGAVGNDFMFAAAVAGFGMLLRDSEHCGDMTLAGIHALATESVGIDSEGYRAEFVDIIERVQQLELLAR